MGELLGITGPIGSGKTTFADALASVEPSHAQHETHSVVGEIGNAFNHALKAELSFGADGSNSTLANQVLLWLPDAISENLHTDTTFEQLEIRRQHTAINPELYEKLFTYLDAVKANPKLLDHPITAENKTDYRPLLQWLGGYLVAKVSKTIWYDELMRRVQLRDADKNMVLVLGVRYPSDAEVIRSFGGKIVAIKRPGLTPTDSKDVTEAQLSAIEPDITIINNGDQEALQLVAENLWRDLGAGVAKATYTADSKK